MDETRYGTVTEAESAQLQKHETNLRRDFHGSFVHGLDSKGRMIVPASFRPALGEKFIICLSPDFKAIALYSRLAWELEYCKLLDLREKDMRMERIINLFSKYTYEDCECDAQGRVLLPQKLRNRFLKDAKEVDVGGVGSYIKVIPLQDAEKEEDEFFENPPDVLGFEANVAKGI